METEERTAPTAYGALEVVCELCMKANKVRVEVGPEGREWFYVKCESCGERQTLVVEVK